MLRAVKFAAIALAGLLLLAVLGLAVLLTWPRPAAEYLASRLLDRPVAVGEISIRWQDPVQVSVRDLHIANMPGGSSPDMVAIDALDAAIDRDALLQGKLVYERLRIERPRIALERNAEGRGNWVFGSKAGSGSEAEATAASGNRLVLIPKDRTQFPTLLDFRLSGGELRFRTSSGKWLRLPLDDLGIQSADETSPVSIVFDGGYNDTDMQLTASVGSFTAFRDATQPFEAAFNIAAPGVKLDFKGVIGAPLDFDDVEGRLSLEARRLDDLVAVFDQAPGIGAPLRLSGALSRDGDAWRLDNLGGDLGGNRFEGRLALDEGGRGEPDALQIRLDFDKLDLAGLLPQGKDDWRATSLRPETAADSAHLDLQIGAAQLRYGALSLRQAAAAIEMEAGHIHLHGATAAMGKDGHLQLSGRLDAVGPTAATAQARLRLQHAEAVDLLQALGLTGDLLAGTLDGLASVDAEGATLGDMLQQARGHAVLAMQDGRIARKLVEAGSVDLRAALRSRDEATALRCLLGAAVLRNGTLVLAPLILRSDGGTLRGAGQVDLAQQSLEMTLRSDPKTTGLFALDIPLRIHGPLAAPAVQPIRGASLPALPPPALPPEQQALAQGNACAR